MKESDPIEKAEKDFWKIIEEEKRRRDRKTVLVRYFLSPPFSLMISKLFFSQGDEKAAAEGGAMAQADSAANATAHKAE